MTARHTSVAELRALAETGMTAAEAGRKLGIREDTVRRRAKALGVVFRHYGRAWSDSDPDAATERLRTTIEQVT